MDALTELPNRTYFLEHAEATLKETNAAHANLVLKRSRSGAGSASALDARLEPVDGLIGVTMIFDLDDFKSINDHWGHTVGDDVLRQVGARIDAIIKEQCPGKESSCFVARLGADEFIVMMRDISGNPMEANAKAAEVCANILAAIEQPIVTDAETSARAAAAAASAYNYRDVSRTDWSAAVLDGADSGFDIGARREHFITATAGLTLFGMVNLTPKDLLSRADSALHAAKTDGRGGYRFFDAGMQQSLARRSMLEADLRKAIIASQFFLVYQPQINANGRVVGAEALLRWRHPEMGLIPPSEFIPVAEATGLIVPIGEWVLERASRTVRRWGQASLLGLDCPSAFSELSLAVNVSTRQFRHPDFVSQVLRALENAGAAPERMKLELTESLLAFDLDEVVVKMSRLKSYGLQFSLDDFGTGYSSLRYLKNLPLNQLKIDQSFVADVLNNESDANIARTIITLGEQLNLDVIAEGVETDAQMEWLATNNCSVYQGYLFSKPLTLEDFEEFVINRYVRG